MGSAIKYRYRFASLAGDKLLQLIKSDTELHRSGNNSHHSKRAHAPFGDGKSVRKLLHNKLAHLLAAFDAVEVYTLRICRDVDIGVVLHTVDCNLLHLTSSDIVYLQYR